MKQISRKLRSQSGATMLIAILFMMFCLFVGGSVLAAASANGYRVAHMADQQAFLNQRSAGILIADELNNGLTEDDRLNLVVQDVHTTYQPVTVFGGGGWEASGEATHERTIVFKAPFSPTKSMTVMQRLLYETAVCRYLLDNDIKTAEVTVNLEGFYYNGTELSWDRFWYAYNQDAAQIKGSLTLDGRLANNDSFANYQVNFSSGAREIMYDFLVDFAESQMTISADAYVSTTGDQHEEMVVYIASRGGDVLVTKDGLETDITWNHAYIQKGGKGA